MKGTYDSGSRAPRGLLGVLSSWLRGWSREAWQPTEILPGEAKASSAHPNSALQVLAVDDNPVNLMVISALLESRGLMPVLAADGAEAVALACELQFDLILMDLQMPILDGLAATRAIRRFELQSLRCAVPVIACSATPPDVRVLAAHGLNGSLDKPCANRDLERCLIRWCPTYRTDPAAPSQGSAMRGVVHGHGVWPPAPRSSAGPGTASLR